MAYDYSELLAQSRDWAERAVAVGQLSPAQLQALFVDTQPVAAPIFATEIAGSRPLIVAFMGGTGVGKSSLINRLAGHAIAKAGVERPTSREVTLYHHQALSIRQLPVGLPLDSIKISQHNDADNRDLVWIDMPDFDSVELGNRHLVLEWLPHIDVLIYVVSPERYRDNKAWQLLLAEGGKHAWLFVMNQWDRGQIVQYDDFKRQLAQAGFSDPLIFRTSCSEPLGDDFTELLLQLRQLSGQQHVVSLERRGEQLRRRQLRQNLQTLAATLAERDYRSLYQTLDGLWQTAVTDWQLGLALPIRQLSQCWAENLSPQAEIKLWDEWAQNRLDDLLDELTLQAEQYQVPVKPLKMALQAIRGCAGKNIAARSELIGRQSLLNPGNGLQRGLIKLTAVCETLLPLAAMAVVGYQVFTGYYHSAADAAAYLGSDFAIHSVLLIGLSWLIPFFLHKKIQPSLQKTAHQGLQKGLQQALSILLSDIVQVLRFEQQRGEAMRQELQTLIARCDEESGEWIDQDGVLARVLVAD